LLDGLVRYRFGDNAELMGAWASARNVGGPVRSKTEAEASSHHQESLRATNPCALRMADHASSASRAISSTQRTLPSGRTI